MIGFSATAVFHGDETAVLRSRWTETCGRPIAAIPSGRSVPAMVRPPSMVAGPIFWHGFFFDRGQKVGFLV